MNKKITFTPGPEDCGCALPGGIEELTVGDTLASGMRGKRVVMLSTLGVRTPGAGRFIRVLGGMGTTGGTLMMATRGGRGMVGSTGGVRNITATAIGAVGICSVLGCSSFVVAASTIGGIRRICTW